MSEDIKLVPLQQIQDERGKVMHMLRSTDTHYKGFGEVYFSWIYPQVIKGWYKHEKTTKNYAVPIGNLKIVTYDDRPLSNTQAKIQEYIIGPENYNLLIIPPGIWHAFTVIDNESAMVVNCSTLPHGLEEVQRVDPFSPSIPYCWHKK
jgi:dTDP-4-dehydrorhamnose 3,5-epimerase